MKLQTTILLTGLVLFAIGVFLDPSPIWTAILLFSGLICFLGGSWAWLNVTMEDDEYV
jgi:hypothetical protein